MKTSDFYFDLPEELIAQYPSKARGDSRVMVADPAASSIEHRTIRDLPDLIAPGTVVVLNDSKVRKARIYGRAIAAGGAEQISEGRDVEFLLVESLENSRGFAWKVMCSRPRRQREGKLFSFPGGLVGRIRGEEGGLKIVVFDHAIDEAWLESYGHVPLPPYIRRPDDPLDAKRYQTVYAGPSGSIAAPTAGLHLTDEILLSLQARGAELVRVTLHVGLGTFLPVRSENVEGHTMHEENYEISEESAKRVNLARREQRKVLAVGTTSVRTLESAFRNGEIEPGKGKTGLFIFPGFRFSVVDQLLTNFHTPGSSLILLVAAFAGATFIKTAYSRAISEKYRFYSYGDAMFLKARCP